MKTLLTLFWPTYDGHLIAIDARNRLAIWNKTVFDWHIGLQFNVAPLIIKNMVVLGTADNGTRRYRMERSAQESDALGQSDVSSGT
jgi:outer membrane protein assembly factor BamB